MVQAKEQFQVVTQGSSSITPSTSVAANESCTERCGRWLVPAIVFVSFFFNFIAADVGHTSHKYDTLLTPPDFAFMIWALIYALEFLFVLYQLFASKARNSKLVQRKLAAPFIFHQILSAVWLILFSRERVLGALGVMGAIWLLALLIFALVAGEFRSGKYMGYNFLDYCCIEVPFAILLGWETVALLLSFNVAVVKLQRDGVLSAFAGHAGQFALVVTTFALIVAAAILLAGLPALMNPFIHLPLMWACFTVAWRHYGEVDWRKRPVHLIWATKEIVAGVMVSAWVIGAIVSLFCLVAALLLLSSQICLPGTPRESSESSASIEVKNRPIELGNQSAHSSTQRSPRTARSAMSAERV